MNKKGEVDGVYIVMLRDVKGLEELMGVDGRV